MREKPIRSGHIEKFYVPAERETKQERTHKGVLSAYFGERKSIAPAAVMHG
ncbi:hypothetical protein M3182_06615 [Mesobacillus maritimus]|uniref:hypothetical protein n=1 Tax=Mesobacillus maritimus TaxID=1643336 RepID=UPI00203D1888|nr:hypothetical protein [Mesobacillus maritimus]MCM3585416.1 hypothetical protein [Mesobacillus maritimus]